MSDHFTNFLEKSVKLKVITFVYLQGKLTDILGMIFVNSQDLFRCNLEGVNIVLPQFVTALELILCDKEIRSQLSSVSSVEVRRSAIQILLSILPLPLQFKVLKINIS